jgi:hypothetical protein
VAVRRLLARQPAGPGREPGSAEADRLAELEDVVERGLATFVQVGEALAQIRDGRLYRVTHDTFEGYVRDRWGFSVAQGKRLIAAAEVVDAVAPIGAVPASESVARELAPLRGDRDALRDAWGEAVDRGNGKPTAKQVREVVAKRKPASEAKRAPDLMATLAPTPGDNSAPSARDELGECAAWWGDIAAELEQDARGRTLIAAVGQASAEEVAEWRHAAGLVAAAALRLGAAIDGAAARRDAAA